jgi:selenocysteine-specific elongation factor
MTTPARATVVGTAGHIDHGKTSLVRSLTGVDLDTLPEERDRGITIALHFASLLLDDGRRVAFVDVPGHERLVRTMVAGATGVDAVLLCVSAVDGAMPQTREHVAILDLLGVQHGAVVLTMADLVDDDMLELAIDDVRGAVHGTFLEKAPLVAYSSVTGRGRKELLDVLAGFPDTQRTDDGPFRLPVDRSFSRSGFGTVVTGTTWSGSLEEGDDVTLLPQGTTARVRGIEVHGVHTTRAGAGKRTALNLSGVETDDVPRGTVVTKGPVPASQIIDVKYTHLATAPELEDGVQVLVLHGTSERQARLAVTTEGDTLVPGSTTYAQIRIESPLPCLPGDHFVVRRPSPAETLGGGTILDPWAVRLRRRDRARVAAELARLDAGDQLVLLERAGETGLSPAEALERGIDPKRGVWLGDRVLAPRIAERLQVALLAALTAFHDEHPLSLGAHRRELRRERLAHVPDRAFDALVDSLATHSQVHVDGALVRIAGFAVALDTKQQALRDHLFAAVRAGGLEGRMTKQLAEERDGDEVAALLRLLETEGKVTEVDGVGFVIPSVLDELQVKVRGWFGAGHDVLTPQDFKELTGLTRKAAIPLLEWLDKKRFTMRRGDHRVAGPLSERRS